MAASLAKRSVDALRLLIVNFLEESEAKGGVLLTEDGVPVVAVGRSSLTSRAFGELVLDLRSLATKLSNVVGEDELFTLQLEGKAKSTLVEFLPHGFSFVVLGEDMHQIGRMRWASHQTSEAMVEILLRMNEEKAESDDPSSDLELPPLLPFRDYALEVIEQLFSHSSAEEARQELIDRSAS